MSRGLGHTQRAILAAPAGGTRSTYPYLARTVYSVDTPTRAQREAVQRAVGHLEAAGLVTTEWTDEVFDLRRQREWNRVVRLCAATATLTAPAATISPSGRPAGGRATGGPLLHSERHDVQ